MKSWRFLVLNWGGSEGFLVGVRTFDREAEDLQIQFYRFDSRDNMRHHSKCPSSSCPSDLRSGGSKKIRKR
eukprot:253106-Prorocentrum_minimum.AAC.1